MYNSNENSNQFFLIHFPNKHLPKQLIIYGLSLQFIKLNPDKVLFNNFSIPITMKNLPISNIIQIFIWNFIFDINYYSICVLII